jgi:flagellar hook assembly protein FlgD
VRRTPVSIVVYDVAGRPVKTIYDGQLYAGVKTFEWDSTNADNAQVPSGVYFLRTQAGSATDVRKVVVVR